MAQDDFTIREMTRAEVDMAVDWAAAEGWNPGLHDAETFHATDPHGFHVGLLGDEPVAVISTVKYAGTFAFVGFYIVAPAHRGEGYGLRLWNAALATVADRNIGLDGVVDQQANYRKSGFALAYRNIRYAGAGGGEVPDDRAIVPLSTRTLAEVDAYDRPFFPAPRTRFVASWTGSEHSTAIGILDGGRLAGYAVMRPCREGCKIGPLFADAPELADRLYRHLRARAPAGAPVFLDVPEVNPAALELVRRHGMAAAFETARMYTGEFPRLPFARLFGVTTFELG